MSVTKLIRKKRSAKRNQGRSRFVRSLVSLERLEERIVFNNYWVSNLNDSGAGSLRAAVVSANSNPGEDAIRFRRGLVGEIELNSQLTITDKTSLQGNPFQFIALSGKDTNRVLQIDPAADVQIRNLTIQKGNTSDASGGGGILNLGRLELVNSIVTGNKALQNSDPTLGGIGGGIRNRGYLRLLGTEVSNNFASILGGGIQNDTGAFRGQTGDTLASVVIDYSSIVRNESGQIRTGQGTERGEGGGISSFGSSASPTNFARVQVRDSVVSDNLTGGDGAGIYSNLVSKLDVEYSSISGNISDGSNGTGGLQARELNLIGSQITENKGAVGALYLSGNGSVLIAESEISNNESTRYGAILSYKLGGTTRIEDSSINTNRGGFAGGLYIQYPTTVEVVRSTVNGNKGNAGGISIAYTAATLNIEQSTISGNEGSYVGGIANFDGTLNLNASTISGNTARPVGRDAAGGLIGAAHLVNSTISGNLVDAANLYLNDPYITANAAGGWNTASGDNSMENSTIAFNRVINAPAAAASAGGVVGFYYSFEYYGYQYAGSADIQTRNTLIARNEVNAQPKDVWGRFVSGGHNLVGVVTPDATGFVSSDLRGTSTRPLDPRLGPLANNGGATQTHRLNLFSPAINAGDNTGVPATDQRGYNRIARGVVDIGAFEFLSVPQRNDFALTSLLEDIDRRKGLLSGLRSNLTDQIASRLLGTALSP